MDPAEPAIGHQDHDISGAVLRDNGVNDVLDTRNMTCVLTLPLQIVHEALGRQALRLGKGGAEHCGNDHSIGSTEGPGEGVLEDSSA